MSVQTYRHSFEFAKAIEATVEHVVCAGQVPQIVIHYHHRATFEPNHSTSSQSRHDRTSSTGPPGLSSLAGTRIITSKFRYKLVPDSTSEDLERTLDSVSRTSTSTRYPVDNSLRHPQPVRYFTGLSTPEPTPPRLPNRSQSPRRCQSLTREGDQCSRTPAAARNVIPYGWYCRRHGRTGDLPPPNVSRSTAYETCPGPSQVVRPSPGRGHLCRLYFSLALRLVLMWSHIIHRHRTQPLRVLICRVLVQRKCPLRHRLSHNLLPHCFLSVPGPNQAKIHLPNLPLRMHGPPPLCGL